LDVDTQITDPLNRLTSLKIPVNPPYLKHVESPVNDLGLRVKDYYTTSDVCKVLDILPDTFRQRIYRGYYPEPDRRGGRRFFTLDQVRHMLMVTGALVESGVLYAGKPRG
jgi:hypothetical protein